MVSTKGRYALRVMIDIAENSTGQYITLKDIDERQGFSDKYLEGILSKLTRAGYLNGQRGQGDGSRRIHRREHYKAGGWGAVWRLSPALSPLTTSVPELRIVVRWLGGIGWKWLLIVFIENLTIADLCLKKKALDMT